MIVELWYEGKMLDLYEGTDISHTLQINDVAEVKDRQASYTNSFKIPKTPNNVKILGGLGLPSSNSIAPYIKPNALLKIEGFDFLTQAWLQVKSTDEEYDIAIYSGIIEFFKKFDNKTIGGEPELVSLISEINHNKNLSTVIATQNDDSLKYQYLFADFNGRTHRASDSTVVNIDYVVPSVPVSFLFEKIHEYAGYTFEGSFKTFEDYINWYISYPKAPEDTSSINYFEGSRLTPFNFNGEWNTLTGEVEFSFNNGGESGIKIIEGGHYNFNISFGHGITQPVPPEVIGSAFVSYYYNINGGPFIQLQNVFDLLLNSNDVIKFYVTVTSDWNGYILHNLTIKKLEGVDFTTEFEDLKINEFLKDVYNILGLTPVIDNDEKKIIYLTNEERFQNTAAEDWSKYLVSIDNESYSFGTYAQKNIFSYKYNDQEANHSNGYFNISNEHLNEDKVLFTSFTYAVEKEFASNFYVNSSVTIKSSIYKLYEKEPQDGTTEVKYKPLSKRYFYLRSRKINETVKIGSDIQSTQVTNGVIKFGEFVNLNMGDIIGKYYSDLQSVVSNPRIWNVTLNVPYAKLLKIDLTKAYYFNQLQQYCLINKITFNESKTSAELVRLRDYTK